MNSSALEQFIADSAALARAHPEPADCVAVSLHLYGRHMNSFHLCDVAAGTRRMVNLEHSES
jgi:hypothetical protein